MHMATSIVQRARALACIAAFCSACLLSHDAVARQRLARVGHTRANAALSYQPSKRLLRQLHRRTPGLRKRVLRLALRAFSCAWKKRYRSRGPLKRLRKPLLTIVDYSLPSTRKRLWVLDLRRKRLLYHELVSHGKNTGKLWARRFSNRNQSKQSSLGLFVTGRTYRGRNGFSMRLDGLERGINHNARRRAIVMHGAWYVSRSFLRRHKYLGRSWGCPAVRKGVNRRLLNRIKRGSALFIYYPQRRWLRRSTFLRCGKRRR